MRLPDVDYSTRYSPESRTVKPVMWKRSITPGWLTFDEARNPGGTMIIPAGAGSMAESIFRQNYWSQGGQMADLMSPFEARNLLFADSTDTTAAAAWTVEFLELSEYRNLMNAPIHIRNIAGTAQQPAILREPFWFESNYAVRVRAVRLSGASAATVRMNFGGANYYPWGPDVELDPEGVRTMRERIMAWRDRRKFIIPFWYTTDDAFITLTSNAKGNQICKIGDDAHFEAMSVAAVSTGEFAMTIQEVRSKQTLMNGPISQTAAWGTAQLPTIFPVPYLIPQGSKLQINFEDLSGSSNTIRIAIAGRKIYAPLKDAAQLQHESALRTGLEQPNQMWPKPIILGA